MIKRPFSWIVRHTDAICDKWSGFKGTHHLCTPSQAKMDSQNISVMPNINVCVNGRPQFDWQLFLFSLTMGISLVVVKIKSQLVETCGSAHMFYSGWFLQMIFTEAPKQIFRYTIYGLFWKRMHHNFCSLSTDFLLVSTSWTNQSWNNAPTKIQHWPKTSIN